MRLHVNGRNTELRMQEMPPHVTLTLSGPVLDHFNYEGDWNQATVETLVSDRQRGSISRGLKYSDLTLRTEIFGIMNIHK